MFFVYTVGFISYIKIAIPLFEQRLQSSIFYYNYRHDHIYVRAYVHITPVRMVVCRLMFYQIFVYVLCPNVLDECLI